MKLILGFFAGAVWGVFGAFLNHWILGRALSGGKDGRVLGANVLRAAVDLALLAVIVLARNALPFSFEMALAGAAAAMGMMGIWFAFRTAAEGKPDPHGGGRRREEGRKQGRLEMSRPFVPYPFSLTVRAACRPDRSACRRSAGRRGCI